MAKAQTLQPAVTTRTTHRVRQHPRTGSFPAWYVYCWFCKVGYTRHTLRGVKEIESLHRHQGRKTFGRRWTFKRTTVYHLHYQKAS